MTSAEQLPPVPDLPPAARQRMRQRILAEVVATGAVGLSRRSGRLAPAAVAAGVLLAAGGLGAYQIAAGTDPSPTHTADTPVTGAASPASSSAAAVTDCGTFSLKQGERLPGSAVPCLLAAVRAGHPARLAVTNPSVEGAPITVTHTSDRDGRVEIVLDARRDPFGSPPAVWRQTCTGPAAAGARPRPDETSLSAWLTFERCSEPVGGED